MSTGTGCPGEVSRPSTRGLQPALGSSKKATKALWSERCVFHSACCQRASLSAWFHSSSRCRRLRKRRPPSHNCVVARRGKCESDRSRTNIKQHFLLHSNKIIQTARIFCRHMSPRSGDMVPLDGSSEPLLLPRGGLRCSIRGVSAFRRNSSCVADCDTQVSSLNRASKTLPQKASSVPSSSSVPSEDWTFRSSCRPLFCMFPKTGTRRFTDVVARLPSVSWCHSSLCLSSVNMLKKTCPRGPYRLLLFHQLATLRRP